MSNRIIEQFEDLYSRWSVLDNVGKEIQLERMRSAATSFYNAIMLSYNAKGFLTPDEVKSANQLNQVFGWLRDQKAKVDQDLINEMMKHLVKMKMRQM